MWVSPIFGWEKHNGIPNTLAEFGKNLVYIFGKNSFFVKAANCESIGYKIYFSCIFALKKLSWHGGLLKLIIHTS